MLLNVFDKNEKAKSKSNLRPTNQENEGDRVLLALKLRGLSVGWLGLWVVGTQRISSFCNGFQGLRRSERRASSVEIDDL